MPQQQRGEIGAPNRALAMRSMHFSNLVRALRLPDGPPRCMGQWVALQPLQNLLVVIDAPRRLVEKAPSL